MILVNLKGGLGNQMFQYATGRRLAEFRNTELKFDLSFLNYGQQKNVTRRQYELSIFNIREKFATRYEIERLKNLKNRILRKYLTGYRFNPYVKEKYFQFDPSILDLDGDRYLDGHWMSEKYFGDIDQLIRNEYTFKKDVIPQGSNLNTLILNSNSVCVQVRRGDYITNPKIAQIHQTTSLSYFDQGIALMESRIERPVFFIFSDDSEWCQAHFKGLENVHFVEKDLAYEGVGNSDYLQLMTACKHFIISNSTFAWWGAWLSRFNKKIVIAPKRWFNDEKILANDIYPSSWIKL